jgi:cobalt/nickel transport system permease protein
VIITFMAAAIVTGVMVSWLASKNPDGLEWAIAKVTGKEELKGPEQGLHGVLSALQDKIAFLPDYSFKKPVETKNDATQPTGKAKKETAKPEGGQKKDEGSKLGTSVAGLIGTLMVLALAFLSGFVLKRRNQPA